MMEHAQILLMVLAAHAKLDTMGQCVKMVSTFIQKHYKIEFVCG